MLIFFKKETEQASDENNRCSFCSKRQADVKKLIAGPDIFICDECINLCNEILGIEEPEIEAPSAPPKPPIVPTGLSCSLCRFPVEENGFEIIQDRGPLCLPCLEAIRS